MTKLVHHDQQIKQDEDLEQDEDDASDMQNHVVSRGLVNRWTRHSVCRCKSFNLLPMAGTPALALAPTDRLPILHRDPGAQPAYAGSLLVQRSARFPESALSGLKTPPLPFHWRHSKLRAMCLRFHPRDAPDSMQ